MARFLIALLIGYSTYVTVQLDWRDEKPPEKQCVPLYNETGLECCK